MTLLSDIAGGGGTVKKRQEFTSSGSFTVPAGVVELIISACAGGQAGGAGGTATGNGQGGGAGGSVKKHAITVTPGEVIPIVIGAGSPSALTTGVYGNHGAAGGDTTIGAYITNLKGGYRGNNGAGNTVHGASGVGGNGPIPGGDGGGLQSPFAPWDGLATDILVGGLAYATYTGGGGSSAFGKGGDGANYESATQDGVRGGGGGGSSRRTSGKGGDGYALIEWEE